MTDIIAKPSDMDEDDSPLMVEIPIERAQALRQAEQVVQDIRDIVRAGAAEVEAVHDHYWDVAGISKPEGPHRNQHPRMEIVPGTTRVLLRCSACGFLVVLSLPGHWTDDQIRGVADASDTTTD